MLCLSPFCMIVYVTNNKEPWTLNLSYTVTIGYMLVLLLGLPAIHKHSVKHQSVKHY